MQFETLEEHLTRVLALRVSFRFQGNPRLHGGEFTLLREAWLSVDRCVGVETI